jgi:hypothetical protein
VCLPDVRSSVRILFSPRGENGEKLAPPQQSDDDDDDDDDASSSFH